MAGYEEHPHVRPTYPDRVAQLPPIHPGHGDIGDHHLGLYTRRLQYFEGFHPVGPRNHTVAFLLEGADRECAHCRLIFRHEDYGSLCGVRLRIIVR